MFSGIRFRTAKIVLVDCATEDKAERLRITVAKMSGKGMTPVDFLKAEAKKVEGPLSLMIIQNESV